MRRARIWLGCAIVAITLMVPLSLVWAQTAVNKAPIADFRFTPTAPDNNTPVVFDASLAKDPDGKIVKYEWDFETDGKYDDIRATALSEKLFDKSGNVRVTLRVTDNKGATALTTKTIRIHEALVVIRRTVTTPIKDKKVVPGQIFRVQVQMKLNKNINGLGLDEDLPPGWTIREVSNGGGSLKKSQLQWLWAQQLRAGTVLTVIYEVFVPKTAKPGGVALLGKLTSFSPRFLIKVVGDGAVQVT